MKKNIFMAFVLLSFTGFTFTSCNSKSGNSGEQKDSSVVKTDKVPVNGAIDYSGTYSIVDKTVCELTIIIQKSGNGFNYISGKAEGKVEIIKQDSMTYLNLLGINGSSPKGDVEAQYENETLLIQNEGNSSNQYTNFKNCDAKYLELKKEK
jgi:hypothetical protein